MRSVYRPGARLYFAEPIPTCSACGASIEGAHGKSPQHMALAQRLLFPVLIAGIFAFLSGGFMLAVGGGTRRMKIMLLGAVLFVAGMGYAMAWHDKLDAPLRWDDSWIALTILVAVACIYLSRTLLARRSHSSL